MNSPKGFGVVDTTLKIRLGQPRFESGSNLVRKQQLVLDSRDGNGGVPPGIKFITHFYLYNNYNISILSI